MNCIQNLKINHVTDQTLIVRIYIASITNYARAFDWRDIENAKVLKFNNKLRRFSGL